MEAVHVRDASLRLYNNCTHLKKPSEIIRHLEDEFSKAEMKLSNFPDFDAERAELGASAGNSE